MIRITEADVFASRREASVISSNAAPPVNLKLRPFITGKVFDFTEKINIPDVKKLSINIVIQSLLTAHQSSPPAVQVNAT